MAPFVFNKRADLREFVAGFKKTQPGAKLGFVPTMGALHEGHGALLQKSVAENAATVLSVFVNPKQFGPTEDFSQYPRTFQADLDLAARHNVTAVFAPTITEMYPQGFATEIAVPPLANVLCGQVRKGHFDGVCTVVLLLLNLVQADNAYFGMKDFQQLTIIKRMVADLDHATEIVGVPTVREQDGLALSSRNRYLSAEGRESARAVPQALAAAARVYLSGERSPRILLQAAQDILAEHGLQPQYLELRDADFLQDVSSAEALPEKALLALAQMIPGAAKPQGAQGVAVRDTRLIDNIVLCDQPFYLEILTALEERAK